jgi:hypothetical protein
MVTPGNIEELDKVKEVVDRQLYQRQVLHLHKMCRFSQLQCRWTNSNFQQARLCITLQISSETSNCTEFPF